MPTNLPLRTYRTDGTGSCLGRGLLAAFLVSLAALCSWLIINGPQMRAAAEAQTERTIEEESKVFCSKFGHGPETGRHAECAADLMQIRKRHEQRIVSDMFGIF